MQSRFGSFLGLLSPQQRTSLLLAQGVFAKETSEQQNEKCSERFPDFKGGCTEVPCSENEQPLFANPQSSEVTKVHQVD